MSSISAGTTSTTGLVATSDTTGTLVLQTGATPTTALTIDTSQNVGVGVTPSAWNSAWKVIQIGAGANFVGRTGVVNQLQLIANGYFNGTNYIYQNTGEATQYFQTGGYHAWGIAPSGTAGTTATFTQAMTLDASGNLLLGGTSNPSSARFISENASGNQLGLRYTSVATYYNSVDSSGNLIWTKDGTERMRLDSSGNLLVGTTSLLGANEVAAFQKASGTNNVLAVKNSSGTGNVGGIVSTFGSNGNNTSSWFFQGSCTGIANYYLYGNGTSSFTSDQRKKKNIETTRDGYVEDLCKLRVVKYNWINHDDGTPKELGLIAQEVEQVFPGLVQDDPTPDSDGVTYKTLKASILPFMLLKAIQELKAEIDLLKGNA